VSGARTRAALGQNLFASDAPARFLARVADVRPGDRVYDLGAGTGRVTGPLLAAGARIVAVERDANLVGKLRERFEGAPVSIVEADFGDVDFEPPFKVVASPPFNRGADIVRRLLFATPSPEAAALVLQREAAERFAGARRTTPVSLMARPWFNLDVVYGLRRGDFVPVPGVEVAVLRIRRRARPALGETDAEAWRAFVRYAASRPQAEAWRCLRNLLSRLQWRRLSADLGLDPGVHRTELTAKQWLAIFGFIRAHAPAHKLERLKLRRD
jgi:23S rRNA (adenine-N6)-dimethyltransferase